MHVVSFFWKPFLKVILAREEVFMESEVPFYLVLEVFDQIHVGELWTPWQYCDCVIVKPFDY